MTLIDKAEALATACPECGDTTPCGNDRQCAHPGAALPARGVGVKPLVWERISDRTVEAAGVGSTYRIQTAQDGSVRWQSRYMGEWHNAPSVDAAKDAVNMFHEEALSQFVALAPTDAAHVNETAKSEHDAGNVLTDAAQAPFRMEDMTLADLMRDPLYEAATTPATDAAQAREAALRRGIESIRELNMTAEDENGHRWANSDLIEQEIVAILTLIGETRT